MTNQGALADHLTSLDLLMLMVMKPSALIIPRCPETSQVV